MAETFAEAIRRAQAGETAPAPAPTPTGYASIPGAEEHDARIGAGTPTPPRQKLTVPQELAAGVADAFDLVWGGFAAPMLSAAGENINSLQQAINQQLGIGRKLTRKEIAAEGAEIRNNLNRKYGQPARDLLTAFGLIPEGESYISENVMGPAMKKVEWYADEIERKSGGKVLKDDVMNVVNGLFGIAGAKGVQVGVRAHVDKAKAKYIAEELAAARARDAARDLAAEEGQPIPRISFGRVPGSERIEPTLYPSTPEGRAAGEAARSGVATQRDQVRAQIVDEPYIPGGEEAMERRRIERERDASLKKMWEDLQPELRAKEARAARAGRPDPDATTILKRRPDDAGDTTVAQTVQLGALGGTAVGTAYMLGQDDPEAVAAAGLGLAAVVGRKSFRDLQTMPDAAPWGTVRDAMPYTFKSLEMIDPKRMEVPRQQLVDALKRQDVTDFERRVVGDALAALPADKPVTAKALALAIKEASGDFDLGIKKTDEYADYGLDAIGRGVDRDALYDARSEAGLGPEDLLPEEPTTRIYQSPLQLGTGNHFGDPNYFAHTRSFEEGGVRHIVEIQSDAVQKKKTLGPEQVAELTALLEADTAAVAKYKSWLARGSQISSGPEGPGAAREFFRSKMAEDPAFSGNLARGENNYPYIISSRLEQLRAHIGDIKSALSKDKSADKVRPMLKDWHKRIIREEVADARNSGGKTIRFADADTVATVEGWPTRSVDAIRSDLDYAISNGYGGVERLREELRAAKEGTAPRFRPEHQGIYDRYAGDITKFLKQLGAKHVKDADGHGWWEIDISEGAKGLPAGGIHGRPGSTRLQMGAADPRLMTAIAAIGGGAALGSLLADSDQKGQGALKGALIGLGLLAGTKALGLSENARAIGKGVEHALGSISGELRRMDQEVFRAFTKHEQDVLVRSNEALQAFAPFVEGLRKVPKALRDQIDAAILNDDVGRAFTLLGQTANPQLVNDLRSALAARRALEQELVARGRLKKPLGTFPHVVADVEGLLRAVEQRAGGSVAKAIDALNKKSIRETGEPLSPFDLTSMLGGSVRDFAEFFAPPSEAFPLWGRIAAKETARMDFFGKHAVLTSSGMLNLSQSIQNVINSKLGPGKITAEQAMRLEQLLKIRFGPGERASAGVFQTYKNLTYGMLLTNPLSALTNLTDVAMAAAVHGIMPTIKAAQAVALKKPTRWTLADMGLVDHMALELSSFRKKPFKVRGVELSSAKILDKAMLLSGFSALDKVGKLAHLNAADAKYRGLARSTSGAQRIIDRYGDYFGADMPQLLSDLRSGAKTPLVGELVFRELSDFQPISNLEVPAAYVGNPNARWLYTLRTFALRQINTAVDRGFAEIAKGTPKGIRDGSLFLMRFGLALGLAGASMDYIKKILMGQTADLEMGEVAENTLKAFGLSKFVVEKLKEQKYAEAAASVFAPPYRAFEDIIKGDPKAMQYIPVVGKVWENYMMGGRERANLRMAEQRKKAETPPEEKRERARLREETKQERLERRMERAQ